MFGGVVRGLAGGGRLWGGAFGDAGMRGVLEKGYAGVVPGLGGVFGGRNVCPFIVGRDDGGGDMGGDTVYTASFSIGFAYPLLNG